MDFRTTVPPFESPFRIDYGPPVLALGSCFAEHIGQRLIASKFPVHLNPFGILYNPLSILQAVKRLQIAAPVTPEELFLHQDLWHHFDFHSRFSHPDREEALAQMNASLESSGAALNRTNRVLFTWGTAFAYRHLEQNQLVGNCHKLPGTVFERFRLQSDDFIPAYFELLSHWKAKNPDLQVLISVSPVRHLRDGLIENQRSKALLLLAAEQLTAGLDFVHYFPAYELVLDDLRDYRFYDRDQAHPNALAIDYVWEHFQAACFSSFAKTIHREIEPVLRAASHRPFHTDTAAYQKFCDQQLKKIEKLEAAYPFLDFREEKLHFSSMA